MIGSILPKYAKLNFVIKVCKNCFKNLIYIIVNITLFNFDAKLLRQVKI